jgi:hypothetical protein
VNATHRSIPIAMAAFVSDSEIEQVVQQETHITHQHELSFFVNLLCCTMVRMLIKGDPWPEVRKKGEEMAKMMKLRKIFDKVVSLNSLDKGGFAPDVLRVSILSVYQIFRPLSTSWTPPPLLKKH